MTLLAEPSRSHAPPVTPLRAGPPIDASDFRALRRRMILDCCKWDPQVGDVSTLADFPLLIARRVWDELTEAAEALAAETLELERRLLHRPDLHARLGLPRRLRRVLSDPQTITPTAARVMRFDFHPTRDGWRISEVNSDVPGGFTEASALAALMADHVADASAAGDPACAFAEAITNTARATDNNGPVALLSAPGFMEDHQVIANLARLLHTRGVPAYLAQPHHLRWHNGRAHLQTQWHTGPVAAIVRFYQGEWLSNLPRRTGWHHLFAAGSTPVANPGCAILSESKRLPLLWRELGVPLRAWPRYLPETREPRDAPWRRDESWLLKTAYCNTGDTVTMRDIIPLKQWRRARLDVLLNPREWLAQRRFETTPLATPRGPLYPCIGIYTIDGRACGAYARLSPQSLIKYDAIDVAVLIEDESTEATP